MSHLNLITRNSTIDEWRIQTNLTANAINNLEISEFNKSNGDFILSGNSRLIITSNGTSVLVSNNVSFTSNLFVGGTLTVNTINVLENANISGNLNATNLTLSRNVIANNIVSNTNVTTIILNSQTVNTSNLIVSGQDYNNLPSSINTHTYSVVSSNISPIYSTLRGEISSNVSTLNDRITSTNTHMYSVVSSNIAPIYSTLRGEISSNVTTVYSTLRNEITSNVTTVNARIDSSNTYLNGNFVTLGTTQTIGGAKTFSSTITGSITGNAGTVTNGVYTVGNQSIAGTKVFTSIQETRVNMNSPLTNNIDLSQGTYFIRTLTTTTTFTVSNVPVSGTVASFILDLTNGGGKTITWPTNTRWELGTAPVLTNPGRDIIAFFTHDGGSNWNAIFIAKDIR